MMGASIAVDNFRKVALNLPTRDGSSLTPCCISGVKPSMTGPQAYPRSLTIWRDISTSSLALPILIIRMSGH